MTDTTSLLIEIGTEELPPKTLRRLSSALTDNLVGGLKELGLPQAGAVESYYTPRRLAVLFEHVPTRQPDRTQERLGPPVAASFDDSGEPTKAALGFARSCGVTVEQLERVDSNKGPRLALTSELKGSALSDLLEGLVSTALQGLPIAKPMRWGNNTDSFIRPVHWIVLMMGGETVPARFFDLETGRRTRGHRVHHPEWIELERAESYAEQLRSGYVLADPEERRNTISEQIHLVADQLGAHPVVPDELLEEVSNLVEWPVAMAGDFDQSFLDVPEEAIISSLQLHQKMFPLRDDNGVLLPAFITIANLESKAPNEVKLGYERVVRPRLADARFFWSNDLKTPLMDHRKALNGMTFQKDLGSLGDKIDRMSALAAELANALSIQKDILARAIALCKCDLLTSMVGEFPDLQGTMGARYAVAQGEDLAVAATIEQHYRPRFAGDDIADSKLGLAISLVDRVDSLAGIFSVGLKPSGNKDPFALRRGALGVVRTLVEGELDLDLRWLMHRAITHLPGPLAKSESVNEIMTFIWERARNYFSEAGVSGDVFDAVLAVQSTNVLDFSRRALACQAFKSSDESASLGAANKRVGNMLKKAGSDKSGDSVNPELLNHEAEADLFQAISDHSDAVRKAVAQLDYGAALHDLGKLQPQVDRFFDEVLVMDDDLQVRNNRLCLLGQMRNLFLEVADVGLLTQ